MFRHLEVTSGDPRRIALIAALLFATVPAAFAQDVSGTQTQVFPEIDSFFKLTDTGRLLAIASGTAAPDLEDDDVQVGLFWDQRVSDRVSVRGGYRFEYTPGGDGDPVQRENRIQLSGDFRFPVAWRLIATDRSMVELRWINGDPSQRYRNRLLIEREFVGLFGKAHTAYASAEVFYDTRYDAWNYQEYTAGVQTLLSQKWLVDVYYQRQNNSRSSPAHVNAVGLTVQLFLDARKPVPTGVVIDSGP